MNNVNELFYHLKLYYESQVELNRLRVAMDVLPNSSESERVQLLDEFNNAFKDKQLSTKFLDTNKHLLKLNEVA